MTPRQHHEWICTAPMEKYIIIHDAFVGDKLGILSSNKSSDTLTGVWTIFIRCCLILVITPDTSTIPSLFTCSMMVSIAMNVPVRPTPALETLQAMWPSNLYRSVPHSPTVDHHGSLWWIVIQFDATMEGQDGSAILRNTMIRPGGEVILGHYMRILWTG